MLADQRGRRSSCTVRSSRGEAVIVGIDGSPAIRRVATGTEIYARSIIEALAASRADRTMRVYANASDPPPWLPPAVEWRGIPFPRLWTHWRLRQALRRERPDVTFIPSHVLPFALGLKAVVTIHDVGHRREPRSYSRPARWYLEATTRYAAPDDLPALYAGAVALTLPSRFEGFGFPALEAMGCGTAVIASSAGALPEIVGSAGILLSPDDTGAWSQAMLELAGDPALQQRLIAAGTARSAEFTWDAAAQKTWRVLDAAARRGQAEMTDS